MQKVLDALFLGTIGMAHKAALWIILGGCLAALGEQNGMSKTAYTSIGAAGLVVGIVAALYSVLRGK